MSSASDPNDTERSRRRARSESDVAAPEQSAVAPRARLPAAPVWTLDSNVEVVLLRGAAPPADVMLSAFLRGIGEDIVPTMDVCMSVFVRRPHKYIQEAVKRNVALNAVECVPHELFYRVAPFLEGKAISSLKQWAESGRGVRPSPSDNIRDDIWNVATARLNAAADSIKRPIPKEAGLVQQVTLAESAVLAVKERLSLCMRTSTKLVKVMPGAFESVLNATWSHVLSGEAGMLLGMRVVDGPPENFWELDEVNYNPLPCEAHVKAPRNGNLEIIVLSSEEGWSYTRLENERRSVNNNACDWRGGELNAQRSKDVYICLEVVRVWYIVEKKMRAWYIKRKVVKPKACIVIGTPGIGKSFACGSLLLHRLLHYKNKLLDVVAYFVRESACVIHNARPGVPGSVVLYSNQRAAVLKIKRMASCKRGFIIVDISKKGETPSEELPTDCWPTVVLTSPDVNHYDSWVKDRDGAVRHLPDKTERNAGLWLYAEKVLKEQLKVLDERIKTVGPLPRFVLDRDSYKLKIIQVGQAISETALDKAQYMGILMKNSEWQPDHASRKLVELVRVRGDLNDETYKCVSLSSKIHETVKIKMLQTLKDTWVLLRLAPSERRAGVGLELLSFDAFRYSDVTRLVVDKLVYLQRDGETCESKSALAKLSEEQLRLQRSECLGTAENSTVKKCEYYVLYKPSVDNFPATDGFFFVEGHGTSGERAAGPAAHSRDAHQPKTIVLLQATKGRSHHTETGKLVKLKDILRRAFRDWADFSKNMRWEIVYVQHPDTQLFKKRRRCERTEVKKKGGATDEVYDGRQAAHGAEQVFLETEVDQYAAKPVDDLLAALILCLNAK